MTHKFCFEVLNKSLKYIMSENNKTSRKIFTGKMVVFCGDFSLIFLVIPRGNRADIAHSTINA